MNHKNDTIYSAMKKFSGAFYSRGAFLVRYSILWLILMMIARLLFVVYNSGQFSHASFSLLIGIFFHGLHMDLSLLGYILAVSCLIIAGTAFFKGKVAAMAMAVVTVALLAITTIIVIPDLELFRNWGFRMDNTIFLYLKTPKDAMASIVGWQLILWFLVTFLFFGLFVWAYFRYVSKTLYRAPAGGIRTSFWFILLMGSMILPIRGGVGIAPMNPGTVYFCTNDFANKSAVNVVWNVFYTLSKSKSIRTYPDFFPQATAEETFNHLYTSSNAIDTVIRNKRPNVVILIMESFTANLVEPLGGVPGITPNLNRLASEGILFSHMYSSGWRSEKGLVSIVSGYPDQPTTSVIKFPSKIQRLPSLAKIFDDLGYHTGYLYGGDINFASMHSYLLTEGYQRLVTEDDFPDSLKDSKWGVPDGYFFPKLMEMIDTAKGAFFYSGFTLSSHEPYEVPMKTVIAGDDEASKFENSVYYTDMELGKFFEEAKKKPWWGNTVFIIVADHGHRLPADLAAYDPKKFRIPMVWLGGALTTSRVVEKTGGQIDIAATLLSQLGIPHSQFKFSKNLLCPAQKGWAYFTYNDGFGFAMDGSAVSYDNLSKKFVVGNNAPDSVKTYGKAAFQVIHKDFDGL